MSLRRRNLLQSIGAAGLLGLRPPRAKSARAGGARHPRHGHAANQRYQRDRMPARRRAADGGQDHDRSGRPVRLRLRHLHAARRPGEAGGGEVSQAAAPGQDHGPHRRHLADLLRQLLLEERAGAEQRHQRHGPGAVGYQGPAGQHAGLPARGRQVPRGRGLLRARRRRRL